MTPANPSASPKPTGPTPDPAPGPAPDPAWREASVLLVGHGSLSEPRALAAAKALARDLRRDGVFAAVAAAFLAGGEPPEKALARLPAGHVYVVPHFMSDGYFVREKVPATFGLTGLVTRQAGRDLRYCRPPALHPDFPGLVRRHCVAAARDAGADPADLNLLLAAHGSAKHPASSDHAAWVARGLAGFRTVGAAFLEQPPFFEAALDGRTAPTLVAGLFAADGFHAGGDVRRAVENTGEGKDKSGPPVFYAGAVGAAPGIKRLIVAQIAAFDTALPGG